MEPFASTIEAAWENRAEINFANYPDDLRVAIEVTLDSLDRGEIRVCEKVDGEWVTNQWIKKAILLFFKVTGSDTMEAGCMKYFDKVPLKFQDYKYTNFETAGFRVVPGASVRRGCFLGENVVVMPSFVNIGAYVGEGTMVDTWATVGSCAQIGRDVHLSGGVGIGGVLEPIQDNPVIIEDNVFIGARSEIVEGVIVEENSIISMGVFIGKSTKIYNRETKEITKGRVPAGSVIVPGSLPSKDGSHSLACAVIIKKVDAETRAKVSINELLRD